MMYIWKWCFVLLLIELGWKEVCRPISFEDVACVERSEQEDEQDVMPFEHQKPRSTRGRELL